MRQSPVFLMSLLTLACAGRAPAAPPDTVVVHSTPVAPEADDAMPASRADGLIRFDGVYQAPGEPSEDSINYFYYIRFLEDNVVLTVSSTAEPAEVWRWFAPKDADLSRGTYIVNGNAISFSSGDSYGVVDYEGEVRANELHLRTYSHINEHRGEYVFRFVRLAE